ncbi:hypothetical protein Nepgr_018139 [Nepenthes gracilis]|uniref:Uncharacterized protein n=1 Tax=Nepenthes gracilis TaxID=150966 RepID=A0AAD3SRQ8_NEPGR|nr:hypothetical protein Nepgr_018139 [Nepenthes gracilis]
MGGRGSFSTKGPGKGMHSRLYRHILNEHQQIQSFPAVNSIYNSTGIFATHGQVHQVELNCAKETTKSVVLMSRVVASEDIGRQIFTYGERKPLDDLLKVEDAIFISVEGSSSHVKWEEFLVKLT